ncbi:MAG TPA: GGDEF domain-containing protein [Mycobacteriales bacterium]|nr:GGDEF domain-containing protein [Mycobacteriales bacterium]
MTPSSAPVRADLVPLDERLRYLRVLRTLLAGATILFALLLRSSLINSLPAIAVGALVYLAAAFSFEAVWRLLNRRGLWIFGLLLMLDGVFLAWANYETGGSSSPVRYLVLVHLSAVALLASYRTALKLALWHSMLAFVVYYGRQAGFLSPLRGGHPALVLEYHRMAGFIIAFWMLTLVICTLSAVNERELRRRRVDLEALAAMGRALEDADDVVAVSNVLLQSLGATFGFERLALFDAPERQFHLLSCLDLDDAVVGDFSASPNSVLAQACVTRSTQLVQALDPTTDAWLTAVMRGARNLLVVPLVAEGRAVAVVVAQTGLRPGSRIERRVVATTERFTSHAALALRNAVLLQRMAEMAATDGLTALANRRSFDEALARDIARAERMDTRLSIVLLDLDNFKALNDTYGHVVGDGVLSQVAAVLREYGREYDTVARYGGEEFAVVLPGCSNAVAMHVAERLRAAVDEAPTEVPVTASCGVATFPIDATDARGLIQAADEGLYASKRAGRNRVTSATDARSAAVS